MPSNAWNAESYERNAGFVPMHGLDVLDVLDPQSGERILDLGCGDGVLTLELGARGADVVGIDGSAEMVDAARGRGVDAFVIDASRLGDHVGVQLVPNSFDAVFSNAALHWIPQADAVVSGVRQLLKPGGRFVGEFGGHGNISAIGVAMDAARRLQGQSPSGCPWYFPTPGEYGQLLVDGGFTIDSVDLFTRPTPLPSGFAGWIDTFGGPFLDDLDEAVHDAVKQTAVDLAAGWLCDDSGNWTADYVRLRFAAHAD